MEELFVPYEQALDLKHENWHIWIPNIGIFKIEDIYINDFPQSLI